MINIGVWISASALVAVSVGRESCKEKSPFNRYYRLSRNIRPSEYELRVQFDPSLPPLAYHPAHVSIVLNSSTQTDTIILHFADPLQFHNATVSDFNHQAERMAGSQSFDPDKRIMKLKLPKSLEVGRRYNLSIHYSWRLAPNGSMFGAYRDLKEGYHIMTQFQGSLFRTFCPSFDEPSFKAKFRLSFQMPKRFAERLSLRSNMPLGLVLVGSDMAEYSFQLTPEMSPYLLCLFVIENSMLNLFRIKKGRFDTEIIGNLNESTSLEVAGLTAEAFELMENFTGIESVLTNNRVIFIKSSEYGGMEHWGMITVRDKVKHVLLHEIVHQWVGNLVTMDDNVDLWLNEGVTEYLCAQLLNRMGNISALYSGSFKWKEGWLSEFPHPLAGQHFNCYSDFAQVYNKGKPFLEMTSRILSKELFHDLLRSHLQNYAFLTVTSSDFMEELSQLYKSQQTTQNKDNRIAKFKSYLQSYIYNSNFPLVNVTCSSRIESGVQYYQVDFQQHCGKIRVARFNSTLDPKPCNDEWTVPLFISIDLPQASSKLEEDSTQLGSGSKFVWLQNSTYSLKFQVPTGSMATSQGTEDSTESDQDLDGPVFPFEYNWNVNCLGIYIVVDNCNPTPPVMDDCIGVRM